MSFLGGLLLAFAGCAGAGSAATGPVSTAAADSWQCTNDLEVTCVKGACTAETEGGFTPMSVSFDASGTLSVCAYSGCWQGTGSFVRDPRFLVLLGHDLPFSTAPAATPVNADVVISLDREDGVATLKVGGFAQPLLCRRDPRPEE